MADPGGNDGEDVLPDLVGRLADSGRAVSADLIHHLQRAVGVVVHVLSGIAPDNLGEFNIHFPQPFCGAVFSRPVWYHSRKVQTAQTVLCIAPRPPLR